MKQLGFIFIIICSFIFSKAQKNVSFDKEKGIELLEQQYINVWKKINKMDGFRIQVTSFAGANSKNSIEKAANLFEQNFSGIPYYKSYFEPNFRLRVGNYRTKLDAYKALQRISLTFPGAFVLKDQIDYK